MPAFKNVACQDVDNIKGNRRKGDEEEDWSLRIFATSRLSLASDGGREYKRTCHLTCVCCICVLYLYLRLQDCLWVHIEEDYYWISSHDDILMSCSSKKELNQRIHFYPANFHYILLTCWGAFKIFELAVLRHQSARKDTKFPHITIICKNRDLFNSKGLSAAAWFFLIPWINLGNKRRKHIPRSPRW